MSTAATTIPAPRAPSHAPAELDPAVQGLIEDERRKPSRRLRDRPPEIDHWPVYVVALAAQFGVDLVVSGGRDWYARGVPPWTQLRFMGLAFLVDAALAPIGLLASLAAFDNTWAIAAVLPLLGLLKLFANARQVRIDHAFELSPAYRGPALLPGH